LLVLKAASWAALGIGLTGFLIGLWKAEMLLNEKGYYFTILILGLFSVISLQKSVRDRLEGFPVTTIYYNICWAVAFLSVANTRDTAEAERLSQKKHSIAGYNDLDNEVNDLLNINS